MSYINIKVNFFSFILNLTSLCTVYHIGSKIRQILQKTIPPNVDVCVCVCVICALKPSMVTFVKKQLERKLNLFSSFQSSPIPIFHVIAHMKFSMIRFLMTMVQKFGLLYSYLNIFIFYSGSTKILAK